MSGTKFNTCLKVGIKHTQDVLFFLISLFVLFAAVLLSEELCTINPSRKYQLFFITAATNTINNAGVRT